MSVIDELITNRSSTDVSALVTLNKKISNGTATTEEVAEYAKANHRGAYNYTDLNRVAKAMEYLDNRLKQYGYHSGYDPIVIPRASVLVSAPAFSTVTMSKGGAVLTAKEKQVVTPGGTSMLPKEYQEVEYIESSGTQYIDLDFCPNLPVKIEATLTQTDSSGDNTLFSANGINLELNYMSNQIQLGMLGGWRIEGVTPPAVDTRHNLSAYFSNGEQWVEIDGQRVGESSATGTYDTSKNLSLFYYDNGSSSDKRYFDGKHEEYKIYENNVLVSYLIPCYIKATGEAGFYDLITETFFGNDGTGEFTVGPDVVYEDTIESTWYFTPYEKGEWTVTAALNGKTESSVVNITDAVQYSVELDLVIARLPNEYQEIEYIQSSGTQYIDTGVLASGASLGWEIKCAWLDATKGSSMLGAFTWGGANGGTLAYSNAGTWVYQYGATTSQVEYGLGTIDYKPHIFKANVVSGEFSRDDETLLTGCGYSAIPNTTVYLFASHRSGETTFWVEGKKKIYYCKMYTDGALVRDFVPCYIKVTGEAGLYDLVSGAFFGNDGTGEFAVGPDVSYEDTTLWLYRSGDECEDITGGWGTDGWTSTESGWSIGASATKNADNMYIKAPGNQRYCVGAMTTPVDLTGYSKLCMDVQTGSATWSLELLVAGSKDYNGANGFLYEDKSAATRTVVTADISSINQEAYIAFASGGNNADRWAYIYNIWLE